MMQTFDELRSVGRAHPISQPPSALKYVGGGKCSELSYCHGHFIYVGLYIGLQRHVLFNCNYANTGGLICGGGVKMKIEKGPINHVVKMKFKVVGYIVAL
jgi:hypothetical protein